MDSLDFIDLASRAIQAAELLCDETKVLRQERDELIRQLCEDDFSFTSWLQGFVSGAVLLGVAWAVTWLT